MSLADLAVKYDTDKVKSGASWSGGRGHDYVPFYERIFSYREVRHLLEFGVFKGASLRMWAEYLPTAMIYGVDWNRDYLFETPQIKTFWGDQTDSKSIRGVMSQLPEIDVIIDDGSHRWEDQLLTANAALPYLSDHGIYIIEDVWDGNAEKIKAGLDTFRTVFMIEFQKDLGDDRLLVIE
jgi:hypothetical protein